MTVATSGEDEHRRRQRMRSVAIGLSLAALVIVFYVATIVRLGPNALKKDGFGGSSSIVRDVQKQAPK